MIVLVIIFIYILLSLPIAFIYHLFLLDYIKNIANLIHLLLQISFFYCITIIHQPAIALLKNIPSYHFSHHYPISQNATFFNLILLGSRSTLMALQLQTDNAAIDLSLTRLEAYNVAKKCP